MDYTLDYLYRVIGRDDKLAAITFKRNSPAFQKFGRFITAELIYDQYERQEFEDRIKNPRSERHGSVRIKVFGTELGEESIKELSVTGIDSIDIAHVEGFNSPEPNTYLSTEIRQIKKLEIPMRIKPKGGDYDWIFGFMKRKHSDGMWFTPSEEVEYLAAKWHYEPNTLTYEEMDKIFAGGISMNPVVEIRYLTLLHAKELANDVQKKRLAKLLNSRDQELMNTLESRLSDTGSSIAKIAKTNMGLAIAMLSKVLNFQEKRLNAAGKVPLYLDLDRLLHIYLRHVKEMKHNSHFEKKDNFQWEESDVMIVLEKVVDIVNDEAQKFFTSTPGTKFSKSGKESIYFEGDYYTIHIEPSGRISTFHKNRKE